MQTDSKRNVKSPVVFDRLFPATPYTLFINVTDGQNEPFKLTEQFQTSDGRKKLFFIVILIIISTFSARSANFGRYSSCECGWRQRWKVMRSRVETSNQSEGSCHSILCERTNQFNLKCDIFRSKFREGSVTSHQKAKHHWLTITHKGWVFARTMSRTGSNTSIRVIFKVSSPANMAH